MKSGKPIRLISLLGLVFIITSSHCARPNYLRLAPGFEQSKIKTLAVVMDFIAVKGDVVRIERSKEQGRQLASDISLRLKEKGYAVSERDLLSVGSFVEEPKKVLDENGLQNSEPPFYLDRAIAADAGLRDAMVSSFKEMDRFMKSSPGRGSGAVTVSGAGKVFNDLFGRRIEEGFLAGAEMSFGQNAPLLGRFCGADTILYIYAWETKWPEAKKFVNALGGGLGFGAGMYLSALLQQTDYFKPDPGTYALVAAGAFFLSGFFLAEDANVAGLAAVVDTETGKSIGFNFSHRYGGGVAGNPIKKLSSDLVKMFPSR